MLRLKRIVVFGGSGRIGSRVVTRLRAKGHMVTAASRRAGVDLITGEGLDRVLAGIDVVIDTSDAPSPTNADVSEFFQRAGANLIEAEARAGISHHVTLSIVGVDTLWNKPYFRAKIAQESLVAYSDIPHTIARATQFFEFLPAILDGHTRDGVVHAPDGQFQPIAADDVATILGDLALGRPHNRIVDMAGPDRGSFESTLRQYARLTGDRRTIVTEHGTAYFGQPIDELSLVPLEEFHCGSTRLRDWTKAAALAA